MKRISRLIQILIGLVALGFSTIAFGYANTPPIDASYNNRIIDDSIFLDTGTMSAAAIQTFLNSKVPACDTNHQGGLAQYPPPYTCLRDYVDPTTQKSAAQLIYDEATSIGLNPQVILVTLEKEQGLVTDTWPYPSQYRSAMGYGCPESQSVCDSQYYGFYNQVHLGARLLRAGEARDCGDTSTLPGWSVNSKWALGNSPIVDGKATYLASCATGSLMNYTPHRPDSAYTLAADGNYYYGNYNFINFWTSWFGPTVRAFLGRSTSSPSVYLINDSTKYPIVSQDTLNTYSAFGAVHTYSDTFIASLATKPNLQRMVVGPDSSVYLLDSGNKIPFGSCALVSEWGFSCANLVSLPQNILDGFVSGPLASNVMRTVDGSIYKIEAGLKRGFPDIATYTGSGLSSIPLTGIGVALAGMIPNGAPMLLDNVIAQNKDTGSAYLHIGTSNFPVTSYTTYKNWHFDSLPFYSFSSSLINQITQGASITDFAQDSGGNKFLLNKAQKLPLGGNASQWSGVFTILPDSYLTAISTGAAPSRVIKGSDSSIYYVEAQKKRPFPSWTDLINSGFAWTDVTIVEDVDVSGLTVGTLKFGSLALIKQSGNGTVAMVDGNSAEILTTPLIATAYGLSLSAVRTVDGATWAAYNPTQILSQAVTDSTSNYVIDRGGKHPIASGLNAAYGYSSFMSLQTLTLSLIGSSASMTQFLKGTDSTIYQVSGGQKHGFSSFGGYTAAGGTSTNTILVSDYYLSSLATGTTLP